MGVVRDLSTWVDQTGPSFLLFNATYNFCRRLESPRRMVWGRHQDQFLSTFQSQRKMMVWGSHQDGDASDPKTDQANSILVAGLRFQETNPVRNINSMSLSEFLLCLESKVRCQIKSWKKGQIHIDMYLDPLIWVLFWYASLLPHVKVSHNTLLTLTIICLILFRLMVSNPNRFSKNNSNTLADIITGLKKVAKKE